MPITTEPQATASGGTAISFGPFRLLAARRLLLEGDQPVRLGSRALDLLTVLAENAGRVVPKEELIARVWRGIFVEESNLKIQVSALRRAVGDGQGSARYIVTVPGRGYEFVAPVRRTEEPLAAPPPGWRRSCSGVPPASAFWRPAASRWKSPVNASTGCGRSPPHRRRRFSPPRKRSHSPLCGCSWSGSRR